MSKATTSLAETVDFPRDLIGLIRSRAREVIERVLDEELEAALGAGRHERSEQRLGYRNGSRRRTVTTECGPLELSVPRGRVFGDGGTEEFSSKVLPRYQRRTKRVDEAILSAYLAGANTRRVRKALEPLLGSQHLSKSAVSQIVGRLKGIFAAWRERDLSEEACPVLFLDALYLKVRLVRRVVSVPVLAVLGVRDDGQKVLLALELATSESTASWRRLLDGMIRRGLPQPSLLVSDGHAGLTRALEAWPEAKVQRCTQHKWRNLVEACPRHAHRELKRDWDRIVRAKDGITARKAYEKFVTKWSTLCPAVARSIEEAGLRLLTFYEFPRAMWKGLRSTNSLENLNREFRRRTKTQGSFSTEEAALTLLYGLVAFGQIRLRRITGYKHVKNLAATASAAAA